MNMLWKDDWPKVRERLTGLWERADTDRACVAVTAPKRSGRYVPPPPAKTDGERMERRLDGEWLHKDALARCAGTYYGGEAMPVIWLDYGTAGHAKYFAGCRYSFGKDTVWYRPSLASGELPVYLGNESPLKRERETMAYLAREGMGKYFVPMPDNCGILDSLAHLRGTEELLADLCDNPRYVHEALRVLTDGFIDACSGLFDAIRENNGGGSCHGWMHTWSPGRHMQLQADFSVMISAEMYAEFVLPELSRVSSWLDHAIYHLDGREQLRHLDLILSVPGIRMIQWTHVAGQPPTSAFIPELKRIQAAGRGLVLIPHKSELPVLLENLSPRGVIYVINGAKDEDEARDIVALVARAGSPA